MNKIIKRRAAVMWAHMAGEISAEQLETYIKAAETGRMPIEVTPSSLSATYGRDKFGSVVTDLTPEIYWRRWLANGEPPEVKWRIWVSNYEHKWPKFRSPVLKWSPDGIRAAIREAGGEIIELNNWATGNIVEMDWKPREPLYTLTRGERARYYQIIGEKKDRALIDVTEEIAAVLGMKTNARGLSLSGWNAIEENVRRALIIIGHISENDGRRLDIWTDQLAEKPWIIQRYRGVN
jgi:hypothetical protein